MTSTTNGIAKRTVEVSEGGGRSTRPTGTAMVRLVVMMKNG